jgi:hypothetical protein
MIERIPDGRRETYACLIIDDPLLSPQYGCLDYEKLLEEMKAHSFFTEIAFIPWNYKRSDPKTVSLFVNNSDFYAICVHGCNHSRKEFGGVNYQELSALSSTALWRMEQHKMLTGLSYDPVIVFPQGLFSSVAMKALKDQGYFAAFNTTIQATDTEESSAIEYQPPATVMFHDLPLFLRRYPKDKARFVDDLAAGRPILIVEHHCAFKNGYKPVTDLVDWINGQGNIKWTSLLKIAEHYLGKKHAPSVHYVELSPPCVRMDTKTVLRRYLSEVRDNYLETNDLFAKVYKMLRG